mgnify:CR=1 FL=1
MPPSLNHKRSVMMKTVLCLSVVLMLAACGGKSDAAEAQPPKQEANSPGDQVIQNREKAVNAAKSVEEMQKKQAEQIDEQAK